MPVANHNAKEIIEKRREIVAELRLRGRSEREIVAIMVTKPPPGVDGRWYFINPQTNEPFTRGAIHKDLVALSAEWRANASASTEERFSKMIAQLEEVVKRAWERDDLRAAMEAMGEIRKMRGMEPAQQLELSGRGGGPLLVADPSKMTDEELQRAIALFSTGQVKHGPAGDGSGTAPPPAAGAVGPADEGTAPPAGPDQP